MKEVQQAADRWRANDYKLLPPIQEIRDCRMLADAYLAEHDPTPVDSDWLQMIGFRIDASGGSPSLSMLSQHGDRVTWMNGCWFLNARGFFAPLNRGSVFRLLACLGVPLKESQ